MTSKLSHRVDVGNADGIVEVCLLPRLRFCSPAFNEVIKYKYDFLVIELRLLFLASQHSFSCFSSVPSSSVIDSTRTLLMEDDFHMFYLISGHKRQEDRHTHTPPRGYYRQCDAQD